MEINSKKIGWTVVAVACALFAFVTSMPLKLIIAAMSLFAAFKAQSAGTALKTANTIPAPPPDNAIKITLSGYTKTYQRVNAQSIINTMIIGDIVKLVPDPDNEYDKYCIYVTYCGDFCGWIPSGNKYQVELFKRLASGEDITAYISSVDEDDEYETGKLTVTIGVEME